MPQKKWFQARPGIHVPMEDFARTRRVISDAAPVELPLTAYYLRRIAEGDLVEVAAPAPKPAKPEVN